MPLCPFTPAATGRWVYRAQNSTGYLIYGENGRDFHICRQTSRSLGAWIKRTYLHVERMRWEKNRRRIRRVESSDGNRDRNPCLQCKCLMDLSARIREFVRWGPLTAHSACGRNFLGHSLLCYALWAARRRPSLPRDLPRLEFLACFHSTHGFYTYSYAEKT